MSKYDYDLIVLGGGAAGFVSSKLAASLGKRVAMIEKNRLGGECTNNGCIPSKALINSSRTSYLIKNARKCGIDLSTANLNTDNVMSHVRSVVERVYSGHTPDVFNRLGIDVLFGAPTFKDNHRIELNGGKITSDKFIISTGSSPLIPDVEGLNNVPYLTNQNIFNLEKLPESMIILGGGPIGAEMASALRLLGVDISLVHRHESILNREDGELTALLSEKFRADGIRLFTGFKPVKFSMEAGKISLNLTDRNNAEQTLNAESLLIATGRKANVEGLGLENAGVRYSAKGIEADGMLRTTCRNIYACGDVTGGHQFSHMAEYQAIIAARNAMLPIKKKADYRDYAWCIFTSPEIAHAGLTEKEARNIYGDRIKIYRYNYKDIDRGKTDIAETGMSKFICDSKGMLVGAHILGARAGELIHEAQIVKSLGIPFYKLYSVTHIYPTFTDVVKHPAKLCYIDRLNENIFLKILKKMISQKG